MNLNTLWFNAQMRHAVQVQRFTAGEVKEIVRLLTAAEEELRVRLAAQLEQGMTWQSRRSRRLLAEVRDLRKQTLRRIADEHQQRLFSLAQNEQDVQRNLAGVYYPMEHNFAAVDGKLLQSLVSNQPFAAGTNAARPLSTWWDRLVATDQVRVTEALQLGMLQGETVPQMMERVRQVVDLTRNQAAAVVRTGVKHSTTAARDAFFKENMDVLDILRWVSMLDGHTTILCASRDGHHTSISGNMDRVPLPHLQPPGARPPAHPNCRSNMVGILDADDIANQLPDRTFVRDARSDRRREIDFRAQARSRAGSDWRGLTDQQRRALIKQEKALWTKDNVGRVSGTTTYDQWLRSQPPEFQDQVLGRGKARLFRGGLTLDQYVDTVGRELTLAELLSLVQ